ncbi:MAG TPA: gas vesicle protein [Longimicrobiales bacterium]|nr:gas vesicle protein [Longimicrobiales bacterium]
MPDELTLQDELTLVELVNRVLDRGVVITGEVTISVAGVDLVFLGLDLLLTSVETAVQRKRLPPPRTE